MQPQMRISAVPGTKSVTCHLWAGPVDRRATPTLRSIYGEAVSASVMTRGPEAELAEPRSVCESRLLSDWTQPSVMCVSEAENCVKYWAMCTPAGSAERSLICDLRAFGAYACKCLGMCARACLCMHTSVNFSAVLMRSSRAWRCVCVCVCMCLISGVRSSPQREEAERWIFMPNRGNSSLWRQIQDETMPGRIQN